MPLQKYAAPWSHEAANRQVTERAEPGVGVQGQRALLNWADIESQS
jgi:hypothetical protein